MSYFASFTGFGGEGGGGGGGGFLIAATGCVSLARGWPNSKSELSVSSSPSSPATFLRMQLPSFTNPRSCTVSAAAPSLTIPDWSTAFDSPLLFSMAVSIRCSGCSCSSGWFIILFFWLSILFYIH
ncbi:hypothetical protein CPB83DRAFT_854409 [Crepidotus variabilis]|uniref:Uncharacterized protein n=1 Tax=Crepidotus variabilis TaxID=179855 RepID=A0A9P6JQ79_9AGAR|nr:hypothetical protein CPB83DRAFT_854409 [Crepidotus variabilis]